MAEQTFGLHKKISSIFDGVPTPKPQILQNPSATAGFPGYAPNIDTASLQSSPAQFGSNVPSAEPKENKASLDILNCVRQISPPKPVSSRTVSGNKKAPLRSQKNMGVLVAALIIVLIFVMLRSFGSPLNFRRNVNKYSVTSMSAPKPLTAKVVINWEKPSLLPAITRDPMRFSSLLSTKKETSVDTEIQIPVNGIVYGSGKSSAIIDGKILHEGETVRGVNILKITKKTVEFEANGKKWTQYVQRP